MARLILVENQERNKLMGTDKKNLWSLMPTDQPVVYEPNIENHSSPVLDERHVMDI